MLQLPPEFAPHQATFLAWPHAPETWPGCMGAARTAMARLVALLTEGEAVHLVVLDEAMRDQALDSIAKQGGQLDKVVIHLQAFDDSWLRDTFPLFAQNKEGKEVLLLKAFNSWGEKFPPWQADARLGQAMANELKLPTHNVGIVLEGGALEWNGEGLMLTTEECLLEPKRNPKFSKADYEARFKALGIADTLWLGKGLEHDHTDGHIDNLLRFVDPKTLVMARTEDSGKENAERFQENLARTEAFAEKHGLSLHFLPDAGSLERNGQVYPRSYANFYMANGLVVVPTFGQAADQEALATLQKLCPGRKVVGLDAREVIIGGGAFHCLSMFRPS